MLACKLLRSKADAANSCGARPQGVPGAAHICDLLQPRQPRARGRQLLSPGAGAAVEAGAMRRGSGCKRAQAWHQTRAEQPCRPKLRPCDGREDVENGGGLDKVTEREMRATQKIANWVRSPVDATWHKPPDRGKCRPVDQSWGQVQPVHAARVATSQRAKGVHRHTSLRCPSCTARPPPALRSPPRVPAEASADGDEGDDGDELQSRGRQNTMSATRPKKTGRTEPPQMNSAH